MINVIIGQITGLMKYFSVEFHGVGLEYIEEFEDLFKSHGQGFNAIKSRVKKEQISPKLFRNQFYLLKRPRKS